MSDTTETEIEEAAAGAEAGPHPLADIGPGIYDNIAEDVYHSAPGVSVSRLKRFLELPARVLTTRPETGSLRFGSLMHTVLLEPEKALERYFPAPLTQINEKHKAYQAAKEAAQGREIVRKADWDKAMAMRDAVMAQRVARDVLAPGALVEQSFWWTCPRTGLLRRGRTDLVRPDWRALVDLKSTEDASAEGFAAAIGRYAYDWQVVTYEDGWRLAGGFRPELLFFLAVEKEPPYLCHPIEVSQDDLAVARDEVNRAMDRYAACVAANRFPAFPDIITKVSIPGWARRDRDKALAALEDCTAGLERAVEPPAEVEDLAA